MHTTQRRGYRYYLNALYTYAIIVPEFTDAIAG